MGEGAVPGLKKMTVRLLPLGVRAENLRPWGVLLGAAPHTYL